MWKYAAVMCGLWAGCSGDDETTTAPDPTCDDLVANPLGSVSTDDWPADLADVIPTYVGIGGRYDTESSCGGTVSIKLVPKTQEDLFVVEVPYASPVLTCGCVTDPAYPDDAQYTVIALHEQFEFFVELFGDPGIDATTVMGTGALYAADAPMKMRSCGTVDVDPIRVSAYEQITTIFRVEASGALTAAIVLATADGTVETCDLTNFTLVEGL